MLIVLHVIYGVNDDVNIFSITLRQTFKYEFLIMKLSSKVIGGSVSTQELNIYTITCEQHRASNIEQQAASSSEQGRGANRGSR